jgi:hypothetical protein
LTTAVQFQCPRCASRMNFTPDQTALQCDFCHYQEELTAEEQAHLLAQLEPEPEPEPEENNPKQFGEGAFEQDFTAAIHTAKGHAKPIAMRVVQCQSCGVSYVLNPRTLSLTCAYCDSVYVTPAAETAELLPPQALLPFAFDKDEAKKRYRAWFKAHNFHKLEGVKVTAVVGVYIPVWTFDLSGNLNWNGLIRKNNRGWGAENDEWEPIRGEKYLFFDDHLVLASRAPSGVMFAALASYNLTELVAYDARYLADWPAERYTIKLSDAALQARQAVTQTLRRHPQKLVSNAYQIRDLRVSTQNLVVESYKLILLPLWMVHYELNNKRYDVLLNGQTGEMFGEREQGFLRRFVSLFKS